MPDKLEGYNTRFALPDPLENSSMTTPGCPRICGWALIQTRTNSRDLRQPLDDGQAGKHRPTNPIPPIPRTSSSTFLLLPPAYPNDDPPLWPTRPFSRWLRSLLQNPLPLAQTRLNLVRELGRVQKDWIEIRRLAYVCPPPFILFYFLRHELLTLCSG